MKFVLTALTILNLLSFPALAELPDPNKLIYIGNLQPNTTRETRNYVDSSSIQNRGKLIFYTNWAFWKYLQDTTYATKEMRAANCQDWSDTLIKFGGVDTQGRITGEYSSGTTTLAAPGTLEDKTLQYVCKH